jgi:hypothetical protein
MFDKSVLAELARYDDAEAAVGDFLFHGTIAEFGVVLRPSPYDGCLWLAEAPTIAQAYIPAATGMMSLSVEAHELGNFVRPEFDGLPARPSGLYAFALQMGFPPANEIACDFLGHAQSFVPPADYPRYAAIVEKLTAMGYPRDPRGGFAAWVNYERGEDSVEVIQPASYQKEGRLFIVDCVTELRLADLADPQERSYAESDSQKLDSFRRLEARGFDGVVIDEFRQSERRGDVSHRSIGLFAGALGKIRYEAIPARHFDWAESSVVGASKATPEFAAAWRDAVDRRNRASPDPRPTAQTPPKV